MVVFLRKKLGGGHRKLSLPVHLHNWLPPPNVRSRVGRLYLGRTTFLWCPPSFPEVLTCYTYIPNPGADRRWPFRAHAQNPTLSWPFMPMHGHEGIRECRNGSKNDSEGYRVFGEAHQVLLAKANHVYIPGKLGGVHQNDHSRRSDLTRRARAHSRIVHAPVRTETEHAR